MNSKQSALELDSIAFSYAKDDTVGKGSLLANFSLSIEAGRITALMGSSGSGKSTIAKVAAGILAPDAGRVIRHPGFDRPCDVVYIDQTPLNSVFPWLDVAANIRGPLQELGWSAADAASRTSFISDTFRLTHVMSSKPRTLSGGELQRLALARSLSWRPQMAILDETLSSLDPRTRKLILDALRRIVQQDGSTLVLITHYPQDALDLADRIVVLGSLPAEIVDDFQTGASPSRPLDSSLSVELELRINESVRAINDKVETLPCL